MRARINFTVCAVAVVACLTIGMYGSSRYLSKRVNVFVANLAERVAQQIDHPVSIDKVTAKWDWMLLKVSIKNLTVWDKQHTIPLFTAGEIVSTVDAIDSLRTWGLKFKRLLLRNPRLVMQCNGIDPPLVLGLGKENVTGQLDPALLLKLLAMQRRIVIENGDFHLQCKHNADLPFMNVRVDFKQIGADSYSMLARGNIAAAVQPEFLIAINYNGRFDNYTAAQIDFEIKTSNLQLEELFNFIPKLRQNIVRGDFADFDVSGTLQNGTFRNIQSNFAISKITINRDTLITGGTGNLTYKPGDNISSLELKRLTISNDNLFTQPINVDVIRGDIQYQDLGDNKWQLLTPNSSVSLMDLQLIPDLKIVIDNYDLRSINLSAALTDAGIRRMLVLLPDKRLPISLQEWLKKSLIDGEISKVALNYQDKIWGWSLAFKDAEIKYAQEWPALQHINAELLYTPDTLQITARDASVLQSSIKNLSVNFVAKNHSKYGLIKISGDIPSTLEQGLEFVQHSPLQEHLGNKLANYAPNGNMDLHLALEVDTTLDEVKTNVEGIMQLTAASIATPAINTTLTDIAGQLKFTNDAIWSKNLQFKIFEQPAVGSINLIGGQEKALDFGIRTRLDLVHIKHLLPPAVTEHMRGSLELNANLLVPWTDIQNKELKIVSDLQGIEMDLPAPFNKQAKQKWPSNIKCSWYQKDNAENIRAVVSIGDIADGTFFIKNNKLRGGKVSLGKRLGYTAAQDTLSVSGRLTNLDWQQWQPILNASHDSALPLEVDLKIDNLFFNNEKYTDTQLKYTSALNRLFVDNKIVTGSLTLSPEHDKLEVKLEKLNMASKDGKHNSLLSYIKERKAKGSLPLVEFSCDSLRLNSRVFNKVNLELLPRTYGYEITNFSITNDNIMLQAQGRWEIGAKEFTLLSGNAYTTNFGKVLSEWGYHNSMAKGQGELNFSLQWEGGPADFDLLKLEGASHIDMRSGNLLNVNPGLGRMIGLLSLETIQRRIKLDFSDLLNRGFAFDKLIADVKLQPGSAASDNILINSPSAKIEIAGKTGLESKELDFTMFVTPKVGASLPIAAAIAIGNPAVGAAIWLFDKASGSMISEITKYKYKVSGTWDKPQIDEVVPKVTNEVG